MSKRSLPGLLLTLLALTTPATGSAFPGQEHQNHILSDRWGVELGGFLVDFNTSFFAGSPTLIATRISLEDTLGLEENLDTFWLGGFYRFRPRHAITTAFTRMNRSASRILDEEIRISDPDGEKDFIFGIGAAVDSVFKNQVLYVNYQYSFINNGRTETGINAGLAAFGLEVGLEGVATIDDGSGPKAGDVDESYRIVVPVPSFGVYTNHAFSKNFLLRIMAGLLEIDISDIEVRLLIIRTTVDWFFTKHVGIGGGFFSNNLDFADKRPPTPIGASYRFSGAVLYFSVGFGARL
jgi:hypothetical protein